MQHCSNSHQSLRTVKNTQRYEWSHGQSRNETEPASDHDGRARAARGNIYLTGIPCDLAATGIRMYSFNCTLTGLYAITS